MLGSGWAINDENMLNTKYIYLSNTIKTCWVSRHVKEYNTSGTGMLYLTFWQFYNALLSPCIVLYCIVCTTDLNDSVTKTVHKLWITTILFISLAPTWPSSGRPLWILPMCNIQHGLPEDGHTGRHMYLRPITCALVGNINVYHFGSILCTIIFCNRSAHIRQQFLM